MSENLRETLFRLGWRQGRALPRELANAISGAPLERDEYLIVVTQSCDLLHPSLKIEPEFETIRFQRITKPSSQFTGKGSKKLHLAANVEGAQLFFEASIHSREAHDREVLAKHQPDPSFNMPSTSGRQLFRWIARRYNRYARPQAFDDSVGETRWKEIEGVMTRASDIIDRSFISILPDDEVIEGQTYSLDIILVWKEDLEYVEKAYDVASTLAGIFKSADRIATDQVNVQAFHPEDVDLLMISNHEKFDYEYVSGNELPEADIEP